MVVSGAYRVKPSDDRNNFRADIAIDDVLFTQSGVPTVSPTPYIDPSPSPSPSPATGRPGISKPYLAPTIPGGTTRRCT